MKDVLRALGCSAIAIGVLGCEIGEESELDVLDDDVRAELARVPEVQLWAERNGLPLFVTGKFGSASAGAGVVARFYRLTDSELALDRESLDEETGRTALRFSQVRNGLRVVGASLKLEVTADGMVDTSSGDVRGGGELDVTPAISAEAAITAAIDDPAKHGTAPELVYRATEDGPRLAWQVTVESSMLDTEQVFVGALDGVVIDREPMVADALVRRVFSAGDIYGSSNATLERSEGGAPTGDAQVDGNYDTLGKTHRCYKTALGRDSYNATGGALDSITHVKLDPKGTVYNASWHDDKKLMVYGGETVDHRSPATDIDVTAHEIGHGITHSESNLNYVNESGAINEGMSDVYGALCDAVVGDNTKVFWIGEDTYTKRVANDALRYMENPTRDGISRDFYPDRYLGTVDHGGVHTNSGILNLAFYLASQGGKHPRGKTIVPVTGIGITKAARIFHRANTTYLTPTSNFKALRAATIRAAVTLYGPNEAATIALAWAAVGVK